MKKKELKEFILKVLEEQDDLEAKLIDKEIADLVSKDTEPSTPEIDGLSKEDKELFKKLKLAKNKNKNLKNGSII